MIVDDSFSHLTTRTIVHDSFSVGCFGNHWPGSGQKTCCRSLSSHTFTSLSYARHLVFAFLRSELAALVTLLARLLVNYRQLSRTSLAV